MGFPGRSGPPGPLGVGEPGPPVSYGETFLFIFPDCKIK